VFDVTWVRHELERLGIPALKRFGQHFLVDNRARDKLVDLANLTSSDTVLEVGPGLGFLTSVLAQKAGRVIAVEKDRTLAAYLKNRFAKYNNLEVVQADVLSTSIPDNAKIVSSPPYNISSKLVLQITASRFKFASLLLQNEFVGRLTAPAASRDYGRLTVMLQSRAEAKLIKRVSPSAFYPRPKVDSALVTIKPIKGSFIRDTKLFEDLVRVLFTQRRRKLTTVLRRYLERRYPEQSDLISRRVMAPEKRVYEITPNELAAMSNQIADALAPKELEA
jgi:16S rRNA (adenine1518-N6/adenine1519-N6)-dimethyltransferase